MSGTFWGLMMSGRYWLHCSKVNGVPIDGVRVNSFPTQVFIDEQGRVFIDAPDYEVAPLAETVRLGPARLAPGEGAMVIFKAKLTARPR